MRDQLESLGRGIKSRRVLRAMREVPRHLFIPHRFQHEAYADGPVPIGHGQTISQPYIVALMTEHLDPKPSDRVLEIGTGCGYQTAVLAEVVGEVFSIEIVEPLGARAARTLQGLGYHNIHLRVGDGHAGWPEEAPFDAIIVTCAPENVPAPLVEQLAEGGRLLVPLGEAYGVQRLVRLEKKSGEIQEREVLQVRFVPMTGSGTSPAR